MRYANIHENSLRHSRCFIAIEFFPNSFISPMKFIFQTHISKYSAIEPSLLYNGNLEYAVGDLANQEGLYAITYSACLRYCLSKCRFIDKTTIKIVFAREGKEIYGIFDLIEFWFRLPAINKEFGTIGKFKKFIDDRSLGFGEIKDSSTETSLKISCPIWNMMNGGNEVIDFFVYRMINLLDIDAIITNEIVYFGLSHESIRDRVSSHNQWGRIHAMRSEKMDSIVYFFAIENSKIEVSSLNNIGDRKPVDDLSGKDQLCLAEMHYIWLLKPRYNTIYRDTIPDDSEYIIRAENLGYCCCYAEIDLENKLGFIVGQNGKMCRSQRVIRPFNSNGPAKIVEGNYNL